MKKIFIATACAFSLCLTSCASKQAPEEKDVLEETENQNTAELSEPEIASENAEETEASEELEVPEATEESDEFPEPESLEEPEIITLEPVEEIVISEEETPQAEQVTEEEPPVIEEAPVLVQEETVESETAETPEETPEVKTAVTENKKNSNSKNNTKNIYSDVDDVIAIGGGVDTTYEDSDSSDEDSGEDIVITPSRSVTMKKFEYLDVTYPGTGWIYMGLTDDSKDLANFGRKLGTKDTKFTLQARNAGTKIAHFYKNDPLSGRYLDDYIEIIILPESGSNKTHIEAPEYKLPVQKIEEPSANTEETEQSEETQATEKTSEVKTDTTSAAKTTSDASTKTSSDAAKATAENSTAGTTSTTSAAQTTATVKTNAEPTTASTQAVPSQSSTQTAETQTTTTISTPSTLLQEAQLLYNEKEYAAALSKLNQFFEYSTDNRDEALYLKGQILEAKSEVRDIKGAMDAYTSLTKNYPASKLWDSANKRIIYLKRFYLEVR